MKKFLIAGSIFLLSLLILALITLNLNYLLNRAEIRENLKSMFRKSLNMELDYERVNVNIYKLHFNIKNLEISGSHFKLTSERALLDFSWRKFLTLQFSPKKVLLNNFYITYYQLPTKEDEEEEVPALEERLKIFLKKSSPLYITLNNGTIIYNFKNDKTVKFFLTSLLAHNDRDQLLLETRLSASCFSDAKLKLRYFLRNDFLEGSLNVKSLDLGKIPLEYLQNVFQTTKIDLALETVLEKNVFNLSFHGRVPTVVLRRGGQLSEGSFHGIFLGNREEFDLQIETLSFSHPGLKANLSLTKEEAFWEFLASVEKFKLEEIKEILHSLLREDHSQKLSDLVKRAEFSNFTIVSRGSSLSELFHPENIELSVSISGGVLHLSERDLNLTEISGDLSMHGKKITFSGNCSVENQIEFKSVRLELDLFEKEEKKLIFMGEFSGEAGHIKTQGVRLVEKLSFLEDWQVQGHIKGYLKLEGPLSSLKPTLRIELDGLKLKTPPKRDWAFFERGSLSFSEDILHFSNLELKYRDSYVKDLKGTLNIANLWLTASCNNIILGKETIEEFSQGNRELEEWLKTLEVDYSHVTLEGAEFAGDLSKNLQDINQIFTDLKTSGKIHNLAIALNFFGKKLPLKSPEIPFNLSEGHITVGKSILFFQGSTFSLSGILKPLIKSLEITGNGTIAGETVRYLQELFEISDSLWALKAGEFLVPFLNLKISEDTPFSLNAQIIKNNIISRFSLLKSEELVVSAQINGEKSDSEIIIDSLSPLHLQYAGTLDLRELADLFENPLFEEGLLSGNFSLVLLPQELFDLKNRIKREDKILSIADLLQRDIFKVEGHLSFRDLLSGGEVLLKDPFKLSGEAKFYPSSIALTDLKFHYGESYFTGEIELQIGKPKSRLSGRLEIGNLRLKDGDTYGADTSESSFFSLDKVFHIPINVDMDLLLRNLVLPTGHQIHKLRGNFTLISGELLRLVLEEINFCDMVIYGELEKNRNFMYLFADLPEKKGEFLDLFACLYPDEMPPTIFEGPFKIQGFFYTDGSKGLFENSYGKLEIYSDRGYLYRAPLIARVLAFLSPIDLFRGKIPNLETNVLPYEEFSLRGEFYNSNFRVDTVFLSAPGFRLFGSGPVNLAKREVDLTFLVSPFRTLDVILEHIPIVNRWLLGKERMLLYLPLQVTGKYDQPSIIPLHPASIGKGLFRFIFKFFGITEDFFRAPVNIEGFRKHELLRKRPGNTLQR